MQGTPWHYTEEPLSERYHRLDEYRRKERNRRDQKIQENSPKPPIELDISEPGSYLTVETIDDWHERFDIMVHKNEYDNMLVGDIVVYDCKECRVIRIWMPIYKR